MGLYKTRTSKNKIGRKLTRISSKNTITTKTSPLVKMSSRPFAPKIKTIKSGFSIWDL
jgi:hypothetical protein